MTNPFEGLPCLKCQETDCVHVNISTLEMFCGECEAEYTVSDVEAAIAAWTRVVRWIKSAEQFKE